jgi:hypothetical protein
MEVAVVMIYIQSFRKVDVSSKLPASKQAMSFTFKQYMSFQPCTICMQRIMQGVALTPANFIRGVYCLQKGAE